MANTHDRKNNMHEVRILFSDAKYARNACTGYAKEISEAYFNQPASHRSMGASIVKVANGSFTLQ